MNFFLLSASCLLALVGAAPIIKADTEAQPVADWSLSHVHRHISSDDHTCHWSFLISEFEGNATEPTASEVCQFTLTVAEGLSCDTLEFENVPCSPQSDWSINAGHSDYMDFMVVVVDNMRLDALAYFGFSNAELNAEQPIVKQVEHAYPAATFSQSRRGSQPAQADPSDALQTRTETDDALAMAPEWRIDDLIRFPDETNNQIWMSFAITDGDSLTVPCSITADAPTNSTDLNTWQWYDHACQGGDWSVSWGYRAQGDAGIMTVISPGNNRNAYFGWNDISQNSILGSAGPSKVLDCQC